MHAPSQRLAETARHHCTPCQGLLLPAMLHGQNRAAGSNRHADEGRGYGNPRSVCRQQAGACGRVVIWPHWHQESVPRRAWQRRRRSAVCLISPRSRDLTTGRVSTILFFSRHRLCVCSTARRRHISFSPGKLGPVPIHTHCGNGNLGV